MLNINSKRPGIAGIKIQTMIIYFIIGAHFLRNDQSGMLIASLMVPALLFVKRRWIWRFISVITFTGAMMWTKVAWGLIMARLVFDQPYLRLALIIGGVILLTAYTGYKIWQKQRLINDPTAEKASIPFWAATGTSIVLMIVQAFSPIDLLMVNRFFPSFGAIQVILMAIYAGFITELMLPERGTAKIRRQIWTLFSLVFFLQFVFGLTITDTFLQTGNIHLPIPAVIFAGPVYRGGGIFMLVLLLATIILAGPSWCSYLCYIGSWDNYFARKRKKANLLPGPWRQRLRLTILIGSITVAFVLNLSGASPLTAGITAISFAAVSVILMVLVTRKRGYMFHCTAICPIGWFTTVAGKINPFRIRFNDQCTDCQACTLACDFGSLTQVDIANRKPDISCTLCGDCIGSCPHSALEYSFPGIKPGNARYFFISLIVTLHTVFLAVARI